MSAYAITLERAVPLDPDRAGVHIDRLYRAAWAYCRSREDAEDLVQETYARVLAKPRFLRREDDLAYLLRALRNTFLTRKRAEQRRPRTTLIQDEVDSPGGRSPQAELEAREVFAAIDTLPPGFRDVLVAVDVAGLSYDETARAFRVPKGTVMSRLYRARQQVARTLDPASF
jgi:RNA polymerase sigma-70 factor (ECF subfamily)